MTRDNEHVFYAKNKKGILIGFSASNNFFNRYDFVYVSTPYQIKKVKEISESYEWLKEPNWLYVKWY